MEGNKVTSNECQILLEAIRSSHADLEKVIAAGMGGLRVEMNANAEVTNRHLAQLNGKVAEHEKIIQERELVVDEFHDFKKDYSIHRKPIVWMKKNWLSVLLIGLIVLVVVIGVYDAVGLRGLIAAIMK